MILPNHELIGILDYQYRWLCWFYLE